MPTLDTLFRDTRVTEDYLAGYRARFIETVESVDLDALAAVVDAIEARVGTGASIYVFGNGGSAAVASHWVNDMGVNTLVDGEPGIRIFCLSDNVSALTAVANDISFDEVFAAQLRCVVGPEDLVMALSVSGNSPNIIRGIEEAQSAGATTVGFSGMSGGKLAAIADIAVHTPSDIDEYGPIEDIFSVCMHAVAGLIAMRRGRRLHH